MRIVGIAASLSALLIAVCAAWVVYLERHPAEHSVDVRVIAPTVLGVVGLVVIWLAALFVWVTRAYHRANEAAESDLRSGL
jgi:multisubunit Na+/H+ antiporter MnhB subunit